MSSDSGTPWNLQLRYYREFDPRAESSILVPRYVRGKIPMDALSVGNVASQVRLWQGQYVDR